MQSPAPSVDDAIAAIRAYVRHMGWSIYRLADKSGLAKTTLRDFHQANWNPKVVTLRILYSLIPPEFDPATAKPAPMVEDIRRSRLDPGVLKGGHDGKRTRTTEEKSERAREGNPQNYASDGASRQRDAGNFSRTSR